MENNKQKIKYDPVKLGFIGDLDRLNQITKLQAEKALDEWFWTIIENKVDDYDQVLHRNYNESEALNSKYPTYRDWLKQQMKFAGYHQVGLLRGLARFREEAWEELAVKLNQSHEI